MNARDDFECSKAISTEKIFINIISGRQLLFLFWSIIDFIVLKEEQKKNIPQKMHINEAIVSVCVSVDFVN